MPDVNDEAMDGPFPYVTIEFISGNAIQVRPTIAYELEQWITDRPLTPFSAHDVTGARFLITNRNTIADILYRTRETYEQGLAFDRAINEVTHDWKKEHPAPWGIDDED